MDVLGERFSPGEILKDAAGVVTRLGVDLSTGAPVVLKSADVGRVPPGTFLRLEHEASVLREVRSPWLVPLVHVGMRDRQLCLVTPFVPGESLDVRLLQGPLAVADAIQVGIGVLSALDALHQHGVLHRDVKPGNVVLAPDGSPTLVDLGLARSSGLHPSIRDVPVGTVLYLSPEGAGLVRQDVGERSDLYSAGALLYACLAGAPPFPGERAGEVLRRHLSEPPASLRTHRPDVPRALDGIVLRLLRKDPRERYQTAAAALADLRAVALALAEGRDEPEFALGATAPRDTVTEPAFVGRREELAVLARALDEASRGRGGALLVEAPSGGGKTRLLEEFAVEALGRGALVLRTSGVAGATRSPLGALTGLALDLVAAGEEDPAWRRALGAELSAWSDSLLSAMPPLQPLLGGESGSAGPEEQAELRTLHAVARLLSALGTAERPAVVLLDDVQWVDDLSARAVQAWQGAAAGRTLVVAASRQGEAPASLGSVARLALPPLGADAVAALARSMAGELSSEATDLLARLSEGSPFMAEALLLGMVESGLLQRETEAWTLRKGGDLRASRRAGALLSRRVDALPAEARGVLTTAAILGRQVNLDLAAAAAGLDASRVVPALLEGVHRHLLWQDAAGTGYRFVHDRVREAFLEGVPDEISREVHRRAALHAETNGGSAYDLAHHWDQAGEPDRAAAPALRAAEEARARTDLEVAETYYRIAARGAGQDGAHGFRTLAGLSQVLAMRGRYEESFALSADALALASSPLERVSMLRHLAEARQRHSDSAQARDLLLQALAELGRPGPVSTAGLAWETVRALLLRLVPVERGPLPVEEQHALLLYDQLLQTSWHADEPLAAIWAQMQGVSLSDRSLPGPGVARTYAIQAALLDVMGMDGAARRSVEQADAMLGAASSAYDRGRVLAPTGSVLLHLGDTREAADRLLEAERLLEPAGDAWELSSCRYFLARALMRQGRFGESLERARAAFGDGDREAELLNATSGLQLWGLLHLVGRDVPAPPPSPAAWAEGLREIPALQAQKCEAWRALAAGRLEEAATRLRRARRHGGAPLGEEDAEVEAWLATCLRLLARQVSHPGRRRDLLRQARAAARQAARQARRLPAVRVHALREEGVLAAQRGHEERARRLLDEACALASARGMPYEEALSRLERARVGQDFGWPDAEAERAEAAARLRRLGARALPTDEDWVDAPAPPPVTLSLADRFETLLDHGRRIATSQTAEEVLASARETAQRLLRAQDVVVLDVSGGRAPDPAAGVSRTVVARALESGQPVADLPGDPTDSVILDGARSVLCFPVHVHGRPVALFYLWHRDVAGLFGEEELRLARLVASVAGAALENAHVAQELRASEERFRTLFQSAGTGIALLDPEGRILEANPLLADLVGARLTDLVYFRGVGDVTRALAEVREGVRTLEVQLLRPGREPAWVQLTLAAVPGAADRLIATFSDVTTRRLEQVVHFQETERRLLSSELHDSLSQDVVGLGLTLQLALGRLDADPARARESLVAARQQANRLVEDVTGLMFDLRSPLLEGVDLVDGVRGLLGAVRAQGIQADLQAPPAGGPTGLGGLFAFRIVQEALTNARRHARARSVKVCLEFPPGRVCGSVRDDGRGFEPGAAPADGRNHYGLVGMRERAELLGGNLQVRSKPGAGTFVEFDLPLQS